jgi:hypothetical protein
VRILGEGVAQRSFVIHKEAHRFRFQLVQIEPRSKTDLHGQIRVLRVRLCIERLGLAVEPFFDAPVEAEPDRAVLRVVLRKSCDSRNYSAQSPRWRLCMANSHSISLAR